VTGVQTCALPISAPFLAAFDTLQKKGMGFRAEFHEGGYRRIYVSQYFPVYRDEVTLFGKSFKLFKVWIIHVSKSLSFLT
jgi:hypothetical protein